MAKTFEGVVFDKDFILKKELKALGFRELDIKDEYLRLQDDIHADVVDIYDDEYQSNKRHVKVWKEKVKDLLSKPVGNYAHRLRPHRNLLPMMNSEELHDNVKVKLKATANKREWDYELSVNFQSSHADLTNKNITSAGQNKRKVAWYGWADEMLVGNGLKGVISARNLMRSLFR